MKKAVLFDLDGTLLDTIDDLAESMNHVLASLGFPGHSVSAYKLFVGDGVEILAQRALPQAARDEKTLQACVAAMGREYGARWDAKTRPYDGIPELLEQLTARGLRLAVLSNKVEETTQVVIRRFFKPGTFDYVAGARPGIPKKPDPGGAIEIARRMGLPASDFLYVGDTSTDMRTALGAGMFAVGALWGFRERPELEQSGAQAMIARPSGLLDLLNS